MEMPSNARLLIYGKEDSFLGNNNPQQPTDVSGYAFQVSLRVVFLSATPRCTDDVNPMCLRPAPPSPCPSAAPVPVRLWRLHQCTKLASKVLMVSIANMAYQGCLAGEASMLKPCGKNAGDASMLSKRCWSSEFTGRRSDSQCNPAVVSCRSPPSLFQAICRTWRDQGCEK